MKKLFVVPLALVCFFAFAMSAYAGTCTTKMTFVPAKGTVPAYHTMVSPKGTRISRAHGSVSTTCLYDETGNLTYHRLYRTYKCQKLRPVNENGGIAKLLHSVKKAGQPCSKEWDDVASFHYLIK